MTRPQVALPGHPLLDAVGERLVRSKSSTPELLDALEVLLADPAALDDWLRSFHEDAAAWVAEHSYWHSNGFAKLVLHHADQFRIRLHVWPAGLHRHGEPDPHSHRWDFASTVLAGDGLAIAEYAEADTGPAYTRNVYAGDGLVSAGSVHLRLHEPRIVSFSHRYATDISVIHTVEPLGTDLVATLLLQGPYRSASTFVYTAPGGRVRRSERAIEPRDVKRLLAEVLAGVDERRSVQS